MNSSGTVSSHTKDCFLLDWNTTLAWDNPNNFIPFETRRLIETVRSVVILPLLYIIGAPANIINMLVFFKQGLNERINLCLFLLALYDLVYLTAILLFRTSMFQTPFTDSEQTTAMYVYMTNKNLLGLYGVGYMSMLISTVISAERCVCVLFPLRAQRCIGTKVFGCALITSTCVAGCLRFVVTAKYVTACFYEVRTGRTLWQTTVNDYFLRNREMLNILDGIIYGFCLSVGCPVISLITTVITAVRLRQVVRWRESSSSTMSSKEIGVTKMLIYLSLEFVVLSVPFVILRILPMFNPELTPGGNYANTFEVLVCFAELASYINSCVNFFVYYIAGSRYRETLHQLPCFPSWSLQADLSKSQRQL